MQYSGAFHARRAITQRRDPCGAAVFGAWLFVLAASACTLGSARPVDAPRRVSSQGDLPAVLATVGGEKISSADLRAKAGDQLDKLETQYQLAKGRIIGAALDSLIREKTVVAEAQRQGKSVEELVRAEAGPAGIDPTEVEVAAWFAENQARVGGRTLDQIKPQIADYLRRERLKSAEARLEQRIKAEKKVEITYQPYRLTFDNSAAPTAGNRDAPVTIVEYSDFQCPYCKGVAPSLKQVEQKFGDKVRVVYRQFPLSSIHQFAAKAAEASLCANEQGKFWSLHDAMFADQTKLAVSDLKQTARRLGMDGRKFDECLDTGRFVEQVQNDAKEGQRLGVTGTPALFINGLPVDGGAVPYSVLEAAVQKELDRARR